MNYLVKPSILVATVFAFGSFLIGQRPVLVLNVEQLYASVNNTGNAGKTIQLTPGIYSLSPNGPTGLPRPNGGRLDLQHDMSLSGVIGDRSAVVISAIGLPLTSYQNTNIPLSGAIRIGRGTNSIEWLTIRDAQPGHANVDTGLIAPGTAYIRIAHNTLSGSARGLSVLNFGPQSSGRTVEADIIDNDFVENTFGLSEGLRIGNFQAAVGSTVNARMTGNRSSGNQQGRLIVNNRGLNCTINIISVSNDFNDNGVGTIIIGGLSQSQTIATGNTINFSGFGDRLVNNRAPAQLDLGGFVVVGGENVSIPNGVNNNTVNVSLWGVSLRNNLLWDLGAIGARSAPESIGAPGTNNRVTVQVFASDVGRNFIFGSYDTNPENPFSANSAVILR